MARLVELAQPAFLLTHFADVRRRSQAPGMDGVTPAAYAQNLESRVQRLSAKLLDGTWMPSRLLRMRRAKPGGRFRVLSIPTVEDRIVIEMVRSALEPIIEPKLHGAAYAYRPGRSARAAVDAIAEAIQHGATWVALADVRDFFDTVRLRPLVDMFESWSCEAALIRIVDRLLIGHALQPGRGLAQGSSLSPLLSNAAMTRFDRNLHIAGFELVRYCDNLCIPTVSKDVAEHALGVMQREARTLGLSLKSDASRVSPVDQGFQWLGFWLGAHGRRVSDGALQALASRADAAARGIATHLLRARLEPIVRGWTNYFDAAIPVEFRFGEHDALIRELIAESVVRGSTTPEKPTSEGVELDVSVDIAMDDDPWTWETAESAGDDNAGLVSTNETLLREADRLAAEGQYQEAEAKWVAAQRLADDPPPTNEVDPATEPSWEEEWLDVFVGLFGAGQESFDIMTRGDAGRRNTTPVHRPPGAMDGRRHLLGQGGMAVRPRLATGFSWLGVVDIDDRVVPPRLETEAFARRLCQVARAWLWCALFESTGGRGFHVWFPLTQRADAALVHAALDSLVRLAGPLPEGVHVEILPASPEASDLHGQTMTLPLGLHVETGVRSRLYLADGVEVGWDLKELAGAVPTPPDRLNDAVALLPRVSNGAAMNEVVARDEPMPDWARYGRGVERVLAGCAILRHLAEKARDVGHLNHGERLSLLYSLGHLDAPGAQAIHTIIRPCKNYDVAETSRQIENRRGLPVSCTRLREKHATPDLLPLCRCDFGDLRHRGGYATPLLHAGPFRREWRSVLREKRDAETVLKQAPEVGVRVTAEKAPGMAPETTMPEGVDLRGLPPHEWA